MPALRSAASLPPRDRGEARSGEAGRWAPHLVLPRVLRRPARLWGRLSRGEWTPPRFAASVGTASLLSAAGLYGMVVGGHTPEFVQAVSSRVGFAVEAVHVVGNRETSEIDILDRLGLDGWTSLVGFDAAEARDRIAALPWVASATVRKTYPHGLEVRVSEREAFAVWQHGAVLNVIERDGAVITPYSGRGRPSLPLVVGAGAPERAEAFLATIAEFPDLANRVRGYVRVGDRRWDLRLDNGVTVKLPEHGERDALAELQRMSSSGDLLGRDILGVDMRLADRVVVKLTAEAAAAREADAKKKPRPAKAAANKRPKREKRA